MRKYIFTIFLIGLFLSCDKEKKHPVPDVPIYIEYPVCINDVEYFDLRDIYGKFILQNEGYMNNGIIIINVGYDESGQYKFMAYDATCPYEVKEGCTIVPDNSSVSLVECKCCGSKYEVSYGAVSKGPSNYPLKTYKTTFDGECIRIYN